jgi:hypothetical protein
MSEPPWPLPWCDIDANGAIQGPPPLDGPIASLFDPSEQARVRRLVSGQWADDAEGTVILADGQRVAVFVGPIAGGRRRVTWADRRASLADAASSVEWARATAASRFAEEVAREASDPMSILLARLELWASVAGDPAPVEVALEHARRMASTVRHLRMLARVSPWRLESFGVARLVDEALDLAGHRGPAPEVAVRPRDLEAAGDVAVCARALARGLRRLRDGGGRVERIAADRDRDGVTVAATGSARARVELHLDDVRVEAQGGRMSASWEGLYPVVRLRLPGVVRERRAASVSGRLLALGSAGFVDAVGASVRDDGWEVVSGGDLVAAEADAVAGRVDAVLADVVEVPGALALLVRVARARPQMPCVAAGPSGPFPLPAHLTWVSTPMRRATLLAALGRRVRERR